MKANYDKALKAVLAHEGGFVNHSADPGGMTNLGCTKRVWEAWVGRPVTEEEMRGLKPEDVAPLYKVKYWDTIKGDDLPGGVDYVVFDCAINSGPKQAAILAQRVASATQDGSIGPKTLQAIQAYCDKHGIEAFIAAYTEAREAFLRSLPTFDTFGKGWTRRIDEVEKYASALAEKEVA